jgi:hypothetical protein
MFFDDVFVKAGPGGEEAGSYCFEPGQDGGMKATLVQVLNKVAFDAHFVDSVVDAQFVGAVGEACSVGSIVHGSGWRFRVECDLPQAIGFVAGAT